MKISEKFNWKKITPTDEYEYFFGYYDRNPWDAAGNLHLALKVPRLARVPACGETAEIGVVDCSGHYRPQTTTRTWCHQQGCMSLFLPCAPQCFIYNDFDVKSQSMVSRVYELDKGIVKTFPRPVYAISPDGKYAVSLNFSRIPRRGYSYADAALSRDRHPANPDNDGIWLMDLNSGNGQLLVSYRTMIERHPCAYALSGEYLWLNHAIFNCDSSRLLWLFRHSSAPYPLEKCVWQTFMYTSSLQGDDAECILPDVYWRNRGITHQIWGRAPREILVDADWSHQGNGAIIFDESRRPFLGSEIAPAHRAPSHMVFSPDRQWLLADSCLAVDELGRNSLLLIDPASGHSIDLGRFLSKLPPGVPGAELRCDLHPRWSPDSQCCTVDSIHDGNRGIYLLDLHEAKKSIKGAGNC